MAKKNTWTTDFALTPRAYASQEYEDKLELKIPIPGVKKKDIGLETSRRYKRNRLTITIPDTAISESRELMFDIGEDFDVKGATANVRDGILYIHLPRNEVVSHAR